MKYAMSLLVVLFATATPALAIAVPESGSTVGMLGLAVVGLVAAGRLLARKRG